jgi:hypothetical protein
LIVDPPLVVVGENLVGLARLFELCFGGRVAGVAVRMVLQRLAAICPAKIVAGDLSRNGKNFVVVALVGHRGREKLCLEWRVNEDPATTEASGELKLGIATVNAN